MVNNADTIGRLIASDTLMRGERQLLSKQNPSPQEPGDDDAARASAPPISYNDKTMAPVLLTLLDEQLDASIADDASRAAAREAGAPASPNRIAARYAEDDLVFRAELPAPGTAIPLGQSSPQTAQTVPSLDLQTFMQRFLMGKVRSIPADVPGARGGERSAKANNTPQANVSMVKVAGVVLGLTLAAIVIAVRFFG